MKVGKLLELCTVQGIVLTEEEKRKIRYRKEVAEWITKTEWDYFLTLTFKHTVTDFVKASKAIERFLNKLSAKAYGSRSQKRITAFPVVEKGSSDGTLHVHLAIKNPKPDIINAKRRINFVLRDAVIESWLQASSSAGHPALSSFKDNWFKPVGEVESLIEYITKQINPNLDNMIVWDQFSLDGRRATLN